MLSVGSPDNIHRLNILQNNQVKDGYAEDAAD
jgi:hypothetical protein